MAAPSAHADVILAPASDWEYTFTNPTGDATWNTSTGTGGIWAGGPAPFGNNTGGFGAADPTGFFDFATLWPADGSDGDDLWVRRELDLSGFDLSTIAWDLGVDNGFKLYLNGDLVAGDNAEGYTSIWEYSGDFSGVTPLAGSNVIAVALEDHGGLTAFDMQVTGDPLPDGKVPEPSTVALLGLSLLLVVWAHRRRTVS
jgi:hypothetical protein